MPCCGRPNNNAKKGNGAGDYYSRYAYLSSSQQAEKAALGVSNCSSCDAATMGDPCAVCGNPKEEKEKEDT